MESMTYAVLESYAYDNVLVINHQFLMYVCTYRRGYIDFLNPGFSKIASCSFTKKRLHQMFFPAKFMKFFRIVLFKNKFGKMLLQAFMRFQQKSQSSYFISPITLQQLPLRHPAKTIIIWLTKQIKTLYEKVAPKKSQNIPT